MNPLAGRAVRIAILDMYDGAENRGIRCLRELISLNTMPGHLPFHIEEFDVRRKQHLPGLDFDIYISSGGPGNPIDALGKAWYISFTGLIDELAAFNKSASNRSKKQVFLICYSFQLACLHFDIGLISKRKSTSFGVFPVHPVAEASHEPIFEGLSDPFYAVDNRDYQLTQPNHTKITAIGAKILAIEKLRPHVPLERAVMALRFNDCMVGTQFHPEAEAEDMIQQLQQPIRKNMIIQEHGEEKWNSMLEQLRDGDKVLRTFSHILPNFLKIAAKKLA